VPEIRLYYGLVRLFFAQVQLVLDYAQVLCALVKVYHA
jgi:hypothetical protein